MGLFSKIQGIQEGSHILLPREFIVAFINSSKRWKNGPFQSSSADLYWGLKLGGVGGGCNTLPYFFNNINDKDRLLFKNYIFLAKLFAHGLMQKI